VVVEQRGEFPIFDIVKFARVSDVLPGARAMILYEDGQTFVTRDRYGPLPKGLEDAGEYAWVEWPSYSPAIIVDGLPERGGHSQC
jgi:hypothetical protein